MAPTTTPTEPPHPAGDDGAPASDEGPVLPELTLKLSLIEGRNLVGVAGAGASFTASVACTVRGETIQSTPVPMADGVHTFGKEEQLVLPLDAVRAD